MKKLTKIILKLLFAQSRLGSTSIDWDAEDEHFIKLLSPTLLSMLTSKVNEILNPFEVDVKVNIKADLDIYIFDLVKGINEHSRSVINGALHKYIDEGLTRGELGELIHKSGIYSRHRADLIANTETTRMLSRGTELAKEELAGAGIQMIERWHTTVGGNPCDICLSRNGKLRGDGWTNPPPAHPGCQCWTTLEIVEE